MEKNKKKIVFCRFACLPVGKGCIRSLGSRLLKARDGQSLTEILIAISIAAILIIGGAAAITLSVRQESEVRANQAAVNFIDALMDGVRTASENNWHSIYDLSKGSDNKYFIIASTTPIAVLGEESIFENAPTNGLVGHWKFDESAGAVAYDSSGNYFNGTTTSATITASSSCKAGQCLSFNGTASYVGLSNIFDINTGAVSYCAWFKKTNTTGSQYLISNKQDFLGNFFRLGFYSDTGRIRYYTEATDGDNSAFITDESFADDVWHLVVATRSGAVGNVYVDGVLEATGTAEDGNIGLGGNWFIGQNGTNNEYFNGFIDDVRIYNRALSATEILNMYKSKIFTRNFYVENVNRESGNIAETGTDDPSTQKIVITSNWIGSRSLSKSEYITRSKNKIFNQFSWSGASGSMNVVTEPTNRYETSTDITITATGTFKIDLPE